MTTKLMTNPCIRCGKERIEVRSWVEQGKSPAVTHTANSCPDAACQAIVEQMNAAREAKRMERINAPRPAPVTA